MGCCGVQHSSIMHPAFRSHCTEPEQLGEESAFVDWVRRVLLVSPLPEPPEMLPLLAPFRTTESVMPRHLTQGASLLFPRHASAFEFSPLPEQGHRQPPVLTSCWASASTTVTSWDKRVASVSRVPIRPCVFIGQSPLALSFVLCLWRKAFRQCGARVCPLWPGSLTKARAQDPAPGIHCSQVFAH